MNVKGDPPQVTADFTADITAGEAPLPVQFTDLSTAENTTITSWIWDFGDESTSTEQNPTHVYETAGVFTVSLTVFDGLVESTETKVDFVTVTVMPRVIWVSVDGGVDGDGSSENPFNTYQGVINKAIEGEHCFVQPSPYAGNIDLYVMAS